MSFVYFARKPEDVKHYKEFIGNKKDLSEKYNEKRSEYDKVLEKYSNLLKKLDVFPKDSIEHKNLIVDLETLQTQLKEDKFIKTNTLDFGPVRDGQKDTDEVKNTVVKKERKPRAKKEKIVVLLD
jgi:hypothetical protein